MRTADVVVGETYIASIPQRLPEELRRPGDTPEQWRANTQLHLVRGRRITVTVTGFGEEPDTVVVSRDLPAGRARLRLTAEQAAALDLAEGQEYEITGIVTDADGEAIAFPGTVTHTIPARWLRPPGERLVLHPDTDRFHRALVCRDADQMTPAEIDRAAQKALEQLHHVRGLALEDPNVDHSVLTAEADHQEWLRIAEQVRKAGLAVYDPRTDPDAVEHPPLIRFRQT
ncbi:hypothetical protein [Kitasatospora sp. MBT66]|uniref:hypothetical protein n=1 Tax=Kitasatospora sp. MBT66 TaxID=1444769 RepID=UPI0005BC5934|nr:hypothetical protein [Kitasatospora sp. MBT66]